MLRSLQGQTLAQGELLADSRRTATRYLVDLEVGGVAGIFAKVAEKDPPDLKFWVLGGSAPRWPT